MATRRTRTGESRWPTAAAVLLTGALRITLPPQLRLNNAGPALFVVLFGLVIVLILADRGPIGRQATWRRVLTVLPIALITIANGGSTVRLVYGILFAEPFTQQARTLLAAGGVIWLTNVIAFAPVVLGSGSRRRGRPRARVHRRPGIPVPRDAESRTRP